MNKYSIIICLTVTSQLVLFSIIITDAFASTFNIQQIKDDPRDMKSSYPLYGTTKDCGRDFPIPDIVAVAYNSDGDTLNNTIWLREKFRDPSRTGSYANITISLIDLTNKSQTSSLENPDILIGDNGIQPRRDVDKSTVSKITTRNSTLYNYTSNDGSIVIMEDNLPKVYVITFDTTKELFNFYWPKAKKIFDALMNAPGEINVKNLIYKSDWSESEERPNNAIARLIPTSPQWKNVRYSMTLQVLPSRYDRPTSDYIVSLIWNPPDKNWIRTVEQISAYTPVPPEKRIEQQEKLLSAKKISNPDFSNTYGNGSHVDLSLNLKSIGYPDTYVVGSSVYSNFQRTNESKTIYCSITDYTSWTPLPKPKVGISLSPNIFTLSPSEKIPIQVDVNSSSNSPLIISFHPTTTKENLTLKYSPTELSMPPYGKDSTTLYISAPNNLSLNSNVSRDVTLPVIGYVGFPEDYIDTSPSILNNASQTEQVSTKEYGHVKLLTEQEKFNQYLNETFNKVSTSMKELSSLVVAIVAIVTPSAAVLGRRFVRKRLPAANDAIYYAAGVTTLIAGVLHIAITPILRLFNEYVAIFFLLSGIFQLFLIVTLVKEWKKWYYFGAAGTIIIIVISMLTPINESKASIEIWIAIEAFQVAFVILSTMLIVRKIRSSGAPFSLRDAHTSS